MGRYQFCERKGDAPSKATDRHNKLVIVGNRLRTEAIEDES